MVIKVAQLISTSELPLDSDSEMSDSIQYCIELILNKRSGLQYLFYRELSEGVMTVCLSYSFLFLMLFQSQ